MKVVYYIGCLLIGCCLMAWTPWSVDRAQAVVAQAATGNIVVNQQFTSSMQSQISNAGVYVLHIETASGTLVGQFVVQ